MGSKNITVRALLFASVAFGAWGGWGRASVAAPRQASPSQDERDERGLWKQRFRPAQKEQRKGVRPPAAQAGQGTRKSSPAGAAAATGKTAPGVVRYRPVPYTAGAAAAPQKGPQKSGPKRAQTSDKPLPPPPHDAVERVIGFTLWRLRPSSPGDGARMFVQDEASGRREELTPVRLEAGTPLSAGERVRFGIESPDKGYLYVIDREQFADGTLGDAWLIFPTLRTRGGNNLVGQGQLVEVPDRGDDRPYFTVRPLSSRPDQVGELLTIIVTDRPLELSIGRNAQRLGPETVAAWEERWRAQTEQREQVGGAGQLWTEAEAEVGRGLGRGFVQDDPMPQTIYSVRTRPGRALLVSVSIPFR
ncbi:MAG TPA: hypothetical protein VF586_02585 [Pyrinomonadaceae bacterium]